MFKLLSNGWGVRVALLLFSSVLTGCVSLPLPPKDLPPITVDGIRSATAISLPVTYKTYDPKGKLELPQGIDITQSLSPDDAAAVALLNNPQFNADLAQLGISRGDLMDAMQIRNPRLDLLYPLGSKPFELLLNLPLEMIWERPARIGAADAAYERLAQSLVQNALNVVQDAKLTHANLVLAKKREAVLRRAFELRVRISKINSGLRVEAGEVTEAEGIATEVDSASADEIWTQAKHETSLALQRFKFALGLMFEDSPLTVKPSTSTVGKPLSANELVDKALKQRADLRALAIGIKAAARRAEWEEMRISQLSLLLNSKEVGNQGVLTGPGLSVELPIFHQNDGLRARADAEVELIARQYFALQQRVAFEVREALELLVQAQEVLIRTRTKVLPLLKKTVSIAEAEYEKRAASYLFVLEQSRRLVDAQLREADFEAQVVRAETQLARAVGGNL